MHRTWTTACAALAACAGLPATTSLAQSFGWAFPEPPRTASNAASPPARPRQTVPQAERVYDEAAIKDLFHAVDWFPSRHPPAPRPVLAGHRPDAMACGYCHLPDGQGRPENAALAGLPADYIVRQVRDIRTGTRTDAVAHWGPTGFMARAARGWAPDEAAAAARYFSRLPYRKAFRLIEASEIPAVEPTFGLYRLAPAGGREPLGERVVEVPNDLERFELRDNRPGYSIYVPPGAVAAGRALAHGAAVGVPACVSCHGARLEGGLGPPLAGRYPAYLFRQLLAFSRGARSGADAAQMILVAKAMTPRQMIGAAAYAASLEP